MRCSDLVCVPGPLHPDMFDGETPIMDPVVKPSKSREAQGAREDELATRRVRQSGDNNNDNV